MAPRFRLRAADRGDLDLFWRIHRTAIRPYAERAWGHWDEEWQESHFRGRFDPERFQAIEVEEGTAGYLELAVDDAALEVASLELGLAHQRKGIGSELLRCILEEAATMGLPVHLRVPRGNPARRLYERLGFIPIGETEAHIEMAWRPPGR